MLISSETVNNIFHDCLFRDEEPHDEYIVAEGITLSVGFHPKRIESHADEIHDILMNLPTEFHENSGGGYSFIYMVMDRGHEHWCGQKTAQELMLLGIASGWLSVLVPKDLWEAFPGGVPYVVVTNERKTVPLTKAE